MGYGTIHGSLGYEEKPIKKKNSLPIGIIIKLYNILIKSTKGIREGGGGGKTLVNKIG